MVAVCSSSKQFVPIPMVPILDFYNQQNKKVNNGFIHSDSLSSFCHSYNGRPAVYYMVTGDIGMQSFQVMGANNLGYCTPIRFNALEEYNTRK